MAAYMIRETYGSDSYGFRGWSTAEDEAYLFPTREAAEAIGEERCQARTWRVVEVEGEEAPDDYPRPRRAPAGSDA